MESQQYKPDVPVPPRLLDSLMEMVGDIVLTTNPDGQLLSWNKRLLDYLCIDDTDLSDKNIRDLFAGHEVGLSALLKGNNNHPRQMFLLGTNPVKTFLLQARPVITEDKQRVVLVVAREAANQAEEQLQKLVDNLPFLVYVLTPDNRFILANRKFCEFTGFTAEQIINKQVSEFFSEEITALLLQENDNVSDKRKATSYDTTLELKTGTLNLSTDKFPLLDENNDVCAICGVVEDVTTQHQLQRQLQQTQKMEAIGQLTGGIAHDFNNILASIMGYSGLVRRRARKYNDVTIEGYLDQINRSGERARNLVQQLLAFSRGDVDGLQVLDPEPLTREGIEMLRSMIPSSISLNLKLRMNNVRHYIEVDPVQFNQGLMNLVINARDAIKADTGNIDVTLEYLSHARGLCSSCHIPFSGRFIRLSVSDNGEGIKKAIISRIFDPFFTTKGVGKGSGMGLSMLHGIVHSSGGHIMIKSSDRGTATGTRIDIYFPEVHPRTVEEKAPDYTQTSSENTAVGNRIVVIDDEPLLTQYMKELLQLHGYQATVFNNPLKAMNYLEQYLQQVDLVITDQTMPGLTGIELVAKLRQNETRIPVILCSGYSEVALDSHAASSEVDIFLEKPFTDKSLMASISSLLA